MVDAATIRRPGSLQDVIPASADYSSGRSCDLWTSLNDIRVTGGFRNRGCRVAEHMPAIGSWPGDLGSWPGIHSRPRYPRKFDMGKGAGPLPTAIPWWVRNCKKQPYGTPRSTMEFGCCRGGRGTAQTAERRTAPISSYCH